jgi:hypothetical protein
MEAAREAAVQLISATHFFNRLTNLDPLLVLDLRSAQDYERNHLSGSYWINYPQDGSQEEQQLADNLRDELVRVFSQRDFYGQVILIFVTSESQSLDPPSPSSGSITPLSKQLSQIWQWKHNPSTEPSATTASSIFEKIHSILLLDCSFDQLYGRYSLCESFFQIFDQKKAPRSNVKSYPNEILPGRLYLGHERHANDVSVLNHLRITHVIDATGVNASEETASSLGLAYLPLHLWDSPDQDIAQYFDLSNEFIHTALTYPVEHGPYAVLVHCRAGISRSTTLVIAYLLYLFAQHNPPSSAPHSSSHTVLSSLTALCPISAERPFRDIMSHLLLQRPVIYPNKGFCSQLLTYEASLFLSQTETLEDTAVASEDQVSCSSARSKTTLSYEHYGDIKKHIRSALHWKNDLSSAVGARDERALPSLASHSDEKGDGRCLYDDEDYLRSVGAYDEANTSDTTKSDSQKATKKPFLRRGEGKQTKPLVKTKTDPGPNNNTKTSPPWRRSAESLGKIQRRSNEEGEQVDGKDEGEVCNLKDLSSFKSP